MQFKRKQFYQILINTLKAGLSGSGMALLSLIAQKLREISGDSDENY